MLMRIRSPLLGENKGRGFSVLLGVLLVWLAVFKTEHYKKNRLKRPKVNSNLFLQYHCLLTTFKSEVVTTHSLITPGSTTQCNKCLWSKHMICLILYVRLHLDRKIHGMTMLPLSTGRNYLWDHSIISYFLSCIRNSYHLTAQNTVFLKL